MFNFVLFHIFNILFFNNFPWQELSLEEHGRVVKVWEIDGFKKKVEAIKEIDISASSLAVLDLNSDFFILEKNSEQISSIASISKLMSALVFMDLGIDFDAYYKIKKEDHRIGGRDYLFFGEEVKNIDLLALSLIASDNTAIIALISSSGLSEEEFVKKMNDKAKELKLYKTHFEDPTGLNNDNVSTAKEVAIMTKKAFENEIVSDLAKKYEYSFETRNGRLKKINSTNELLLGFKGMDIDGQVISGKTGYNILAGYCLSLKFNTSNDREFISVVLNSKGIRDRFIDSEKIISQIAEIYK